MPCAAFVVSAVQKALGGRGGPPPRAERRDSRRIDGEMEERKMFCTKCGKQLSDDMAFCPNCGNKVADNVPHQAASPQAADHIPYQAAPPKRAKKPSKAKKVIIAIAVIIAVLYAGLRFANSSTDRFEQALAGTWIASFADGAAECRLHFNDSGDKGSAMLTRFDETGKCIGYFEIIYVGEVTFTKKDEGNKITSGVITMENVSNKDNSDHDYELPYMTIQYEFNAKTKKLTLESTYLSNYFYDVADHLTFKHMNDDYYPKTGERYYDWNLFD